MNSPCWLVSNSQVTISYLILDHDLRSNHPTGIVSTVLDDHKTLAEMAAGVTLAPAYVPALFDKLFASSLASGQDAKKPTIVFIMCGGYKVFLRDMDFYRTHLDAYPAVKDDGVKSCVVGVDGQEFTMNFSDA